MNNLSKYYRNFEAPKQIDHIVIRSKLSGEVLVDTDMSNITIDELGMYNYLCKTPNNKIFTMTVTRNNYEELYNNYKQQLIQMEKDFDEELAEHLNIANHPKKDLLFQKATELYVDYDFIMTEYGPNLNDDRLPLEKDKDYLIKKYKIIMNLLDLIN
jgi:uncharacterized protein with ParB-like and HNH nuclease domain